MPCVEAGCVEKSDLVELLERETAEDQRRVAKARRAARKKAQQRRKKAREKAERNSSEEQDADLEAMDLETGAVLEEAGEGVGDEGSAGSKRGNTSPPEQPAPKARQQRCPIPPSFCISHAVVPKDRPRHALDMLGRFLAGGGYDKVPRAKAPTPALW